MCFLFFVQYDWLFPESATTTELGTWVSFHLNTSTPFGFNILKHSEKPLVKSSLQRVFVQATVFLEHPRILP